MAQRWKASLAVLHAATFVCASASAADPQTPAASAPPPMPPPTVVRQGTPIPDDPVPVVRRPPPEAVSPDAGETIQDELNPVAHRCFVRDVMAFIDRTRVRCHNAAQGRLVFFAVDTGQPFAGTLLQRAWRSIRSGRPLQLQYAPTPDLNPPNCRAKDCRRVIDAAN